MAASQFNTSHLHLLIERMRLGDREAADSLIRAATGQMEAVARKEWKRSRCIKRWSEAEDILQAALLRLFRALQSCLPQSTSAFHCLAAEQINRELIDVARKLKGGNGLARNIESNLGHIGEAGQFFGDREPITLGELAEEIERWESFHEAIERLPHNEARVFRLCYYNGLKVREIVEVLDMPERSVERNLRKARQALVHYLEAWGDGD